MKRRKNHGFVVCTTPRLVVLSFHLRVLSRLVHIVGLSHGLLKIEEEDGAINQEVESERAGERRICYCKWGLGWWFKQDGGLAARYGMAGQGGNSSWLDSSPPYFGCGTVGTAAAVVWDLLFPSLRQHQIHQIHPSRVLP